MKKYKMHVCSGCDAGGAPEEIKLLPLGMVHSTAGDFMVDDESVGDILRHFKDRRLDLVIDYEHQTLKDVQAPAAGWIKALYKGADAIMAKVDWTEKAKQYLVNKEYRYISPVVMVRNKNHKATILHSAAMTNTPAITGMFALVNSDGVDGILEEEEDEGGPEGMELKKLIGILGLPEEATEEQVLEAITKLTGTADGKKGEEGTEKTEVVANSMILKLLELKDDARTEDVTAAIMALKAGTTDDSVTLMALKQQMAKRDADDAVKAAMNEGKVTAAQQEWATEYALKDPEGFKAFVSKAPKTVGIGKLDAIDNPDARNGCGVSTMVLKNMGLSAEDIKKYADKEDMDE